MPAMERTREAFHFLTCTNRKVPKVRSKLRKPVSRQKRKDDSRRVGSDTHGKSMFSKHRNRTAGISIEITAAPPHLPPVTVLPEFKGPEWMEYPWSSLPRAQPGPGDLPGPLPPAGIIPEFSHLAVSDADRSDFLSPAAQVSPKRRAKTPILFVGQLESANIPRPRNALANERHFSASLLAEEYRALLDSPSSSLLAPTWSDPTLIARERLRRKKASSSLREEQSQAAIPRRGSIAPLNYHTGNVNSQNVPPQVSLFAHVQPLPPPPTLKSQRMQPEPSLGSDADTLVAIDEEVIDFKPEFAPAPPPRPPAFSQSISDYSLPPSTSSSSTSSSTPTSATTPTFTFTSPSSTSTPTPMSTSACTSRSTSRSTPASRSTSTPTPNPTFPATSTSTSRASPTPPPIVQKDLTLQICLDLLTRDLSSHLMPGLRRRRTRNSTKGIETVLSTETAALQVWVMIEGYEKLKEEVLMRERQQQQEELIGEEKDGENAKKNRKTVKTMLETWLSALYKIYDELSLEAFEGTGENGEGGEVGEGSEGGSESSYSGDYGDRGYGSE